LATQRARDVGTGGPGRLRPGGLGSAGRVIIAKHLLEIMRDLRAHGSLNDVQDRMPGFDQFTDLVGLSALRTEEERQIETILPLLNRK
jgi:hypothetical protein